MFTALALSLRRPAALFGAIAAVVRTAAFTLVAAFGAFGSPLGALGRSLGPLGGAFAILGGRRRGRGFARGYFFRGLLRGRG
jgi:hypothetical protein